MADTQRTRAAILVLFADNVTGQVSCQDLRDFVVTIMEPEFSNAGDFWKAPAARHINTDMTVKGWIDYSQTIDSQFCTDWGECMYLNSTSGVWKLACTSQSLRNTGILGLALGSYASGTSTAQILRRGIVYQSTLSGPWSEYMGHTVYLLSDTDGSYSVDYPAGVSEVYWRVLGVVEVSDIVSGVASLSSGKWRFDPEWGVKGV